ncbi:MAG: bifunctional folylpolyglutamate synthase/dihydrofolate synthase [Clostridiales bacterium]|jgi:dihydrofolate synthase/folylpolyglutamate synthase|nr:bifunctional folylpolyglutamate synthase/dihydrofolate synthase [Clostridiales bacterium]
MDYGQAIVYLDNYNRSRIKPGLQRMERLLSLLGNPHLGQRYVHVAGTNGKGSTCKYIESILTKAGCRVGVFTSPYLVKINENIRCNGRDISDFDFAESMTMIAQALDKDTQLKSTISRFEIVTALGLLYYKDKCDVVVLEVGLGGLYDSTNVINSPIMCVITKIGLDHTEYLGNTIQSIALEKSGIIKPNATVVVAKQQYDEVIDIVRSVAHSKNAQVVYVGDNSVVVHEDETFDCANIANISKSLKGIHQIDNAATAVTVGLQLSDMFGITQSDIVQGIADTYWPCRLEQVSSNPIIYIDGAHNIDGATALVDYLIYQHQGVKFKFVFGMLRDKDWQAIVQLIRPIVDIVYTVTPDNPRALQAAELAEFLQSVGIQAQACQDLQQASTVALNQPKSEIVVVFGSLYMVGYLKQLLVQQLAQVSCI